MRRAAAFTLAVVFSLSSVAVAAAFGDPADPVASGKGVTLQKGGDAAPADYAADRVIVAWKAPDRAQHNERARGLARITELGPPGKGRASLVATQGRSVEALLAELRADPEVAYAEPDYRISLVPGPEGEAQAVSVNDPSTSGQYSLDRMRVRDAWELGTGGSNLVAVLDTGVSFVHPDLWGRVVAGYDFHNDDSNARDDNGHGTMVAGIIAANVNDDYGIAGISWTDKILPVKILNQYGGGYNSALVSGIYYAADRGAKVISMSVGGYGWSQATKDAVDYAWSKGAVLLAAAGNNRRYESYYPASYPNVISVSATQADDEFTNWSSFGPAVDVSAPGASILTTNCGGCSTSSAGGASYVIISGTSFSTPNTSGVVALIRARNPSWTNKQVVDALIGSVDDLGYPGWDNRYGHGRVNAWRALGGPAPTIALATGDGMESNNTLAGARPLSFGTTYRPSIHPAGDVDYFAVEVPRAGRLEVTVTAVVDTSRVAKSSLPVDPVVEITSSTGTLYLKVDNPSDSTATEFGAVQFSSSRSVRIKVSNWFPNGSTAAYSITTKYIDNVVPTASAWPASGASGVGTHAVPHVVFSEPVTGVSASTVVLRDSQGRLVRAGVSYDAARQRATVTPLGGLLGDEKYTLSISGGIKDQVGNAASWTSWQFQTGRGDFRLAGPDRYATAASVSAWQFDPGVPVAYVATGSDYPDALAGGAAAAASGGPILLVGADAIPAATASELSRLKPGRIVVLGGTSVVSSAVESALGTFTAGGVTRIAGTDRFATAAAISARTFASGVPVAYVATGSGFADALSGGAAAGRTRGPILLVGRDQVPTATAAELTRLKPQRIVVLGGTGVISEAVRTSLAAYTGGGVSRLAGDSRYATAVAVSQSGFPDGAKVVFVASGTVFPDGLSVAPAAGTRVAPLLLVPGDQLPAEVAAELKRLAPSTVIVVGGSGVVSEAVLSAIRAALP